MKRLRQAPQDDRGHRAVRLVLAIDEARYLLVSRHKALSDNIRLHRSKGLVVALASQSPDDYDGAGDDYLENIGLPVCFKTNAASTTVLQNMFRGKVSGVIGPPAPQIVPKKQPFFITGSYYLCAS